MEAKDESWWEREHRLHKEAEQAPLFCCGRLIELRLDELLLQPLRRARVGQIFAGVYLPLNMAGIDANHVRRSLAALERRVESLQGVLPRVTERPLD